MKINNRLLLIVPKARYIVDKSGVKTIFFDSIARQYMILNLAKQVSYNMWNMVQEKGLGRQYQ